MTDEQIIKAVECCDCSKWCEDCPLKDNDYCKDILSHQAVDLINRQKAEIEELKSQMEFLTGYNDILINADKALTGAIEICKSEAIKEFAERLKEIIYTHENRVDVEGIVLLTRIDNSIDNLVKEMTEEEK